MLQTRSAAKPEQKLHEYCKSPQAGIPSDLWAFCLFSVLSASVFCPRDPVHRGWMLCRAWAMQSASVHGCASSLALVRVPARSRGADRPWTPLRAPAVRVSASPPARAQAVLPVRSLASPLARVQAAFPAQAGEPELPPEAGGASGMDCGGWAALLSAAGFRSGRFQLPSFPMRSSSHMISSSLRVFWLRCRSSVSSSITLRPSPAGFHVGSSAESAGRSRSSGSGLSEFSGFFFFFRMGDVTCSGWSGKISSDCTSLTTQPSSCTPDLFSFSMASCMTGSGVAS